MTRAQRLSLASKALRYKMPNEAYLSYSEALKWYARANLSTKEEKILADLLVLTDRLIQENSGF
jgi:hypothetical protein